MTIAKLAKEITKREGLKKSVDIAQVREILGILSDILYEGEIEEFWLMFHENGEKRSKRPHAKRRVR